MFTPVRLLCKDDVVADKGLDLLVEGGAVVEEAGRSRIRHIADRDADRVRRQIHHVARGKDYALANGYEQLVEERGSFAFVNAVAYTGGFEAAELEITKAVFPGAGVGYKALPSSSRSETVVRFARRWKRGSNRYWLEAVTVVLVRPGISKSRMTEAK